MAWQILDSTGLSILNFTSMIEVDVKDQGSVVTVPIERGSFASYNKTDSPREIRCTLSITGSKLIIDNALNTLRALKQTTDLIALDANNAYYDSLTLESFSYTRSAERGILIVELVLIEVIEVNTLTTTENLNFTSSSIVDTGNANTNDLTNQSWLYKFFS